jgi:hypothetical protein
MIGWLPDYVYYLELENDVITDHVFSTKEEANNCAIENNIKNYSLVQWDVH